MKVKFYKYQGTGNDFVMIDDRKNKYTEITDEQVKFMCDRHFGIGADGLIFLRNSEEHDFEMVYYNSDGHKSTMCGNGGRCILRFANDLGVDADNYSFMAVDGLHYGTVTDDIVSLQMIDVADVRQLNDNELFLDTGSPHHIVFVDELPGDDFISAAKAIRYNETYAKEGVNVNFVKVTNKGLHMRTYERGVEDETYSCGTGVTAAALAASFTGRVKQSPIEVLTAGGKLELDFKQSGDVFTDIWLTGPAERVFKGRIKL